ncbi:MAG: glycosyltransferase family A protein [Bacteroidales bacterium]
MPLPEYFIKKNFTPKINEKPPEGLNICVVVPSYNETGLDKSLDSLAKCTLPKNSVEVIVVVNHPEGSASKTIEQSEQSIRTVEKFNHQHKNTKRKFYAIPALDLPRKQAGVGLARQIGMDEAAHRLSQTGSSDGIIACFDADATCMSNYLVELEKLWSNYPLTAACAIRYEHPLTGNEYPRNVYEGIAAYELHLRYYNQASRFVNFPFSYHTVGSSMACLASTYIRFGGMNRRQAGEDFYFLQKIIPHGNFRELNSTCIFPSPRPSNRVPFGTGRAMTKFLENTGAGIQTYNLKSFLDLVPLFEAVDDFWVMDELRVNARIGNLPTPLSLFLNDNNARDQILRVRSNTANQRSFRKRFFLWFDAFMLLKYLNFTGEKYYPRQPVNTQAIQLGKLLGIAVNNDSPIADLLNLYRIKGMEDWNFKF